MPEPRVFWMDRSKPVSSIAVCIKPKATWWDELSHFSPLDSHPLKPSMDSSPPSLSNHIQFIHTHSRFQVRTCKPPPVPCRKRATSTNLRKPNRILSKGVTWCCGGMVRTLCSIGTNRLLLLNSSIPCGLVLQRVWPKLWVPRHQSANIQWIDFMLTSMSFPLFLHFFQPGRLSKGFPVVPKYTLARPDRPKAMPPAHCLSSFRNAESLF